MSILINNTKIVPVASNPEEPNSFLLKMPLPESPAVLVTLEQPDGSFQLVRLSEPEAELLGLSLNNSNEILGELPNCNEEAVVGSSNDFEIIPNVNALQENHHLVVNSKHSGQEASGDVSTTNLVYKIVYPEELNLKPLISKPEKRGRPKKRPGTAEGTESSTEKKPLINARTRSGRITRPPRHIEKDFKKIEINDCNENEEELKTTEFAPLVNCHENNKAVPKLVAPLGMQPKKRNISSQYRCPKCRKAYLGSSRMLKHLQDFPDHGPIPPQCKDNNFEAWNFLVDITQKCALGNRGKKFCEELTNLLHNLRLLTRVLFKSTKENRNTVEIGSVLGSVLNLSPGNYKFNESELLKDITIFTLLESQQTYVKDKNALSTNTDSSCTNKISAKLDDVSKEIACDGFSHFSEKKEQIGMNMSLQTEFLSDQSLLGTIPNIRNSVDDLLQEHLEKNGHTDVLNVDQFVNERFKNITESDTELSNSTLNLDLELFGFHNS